MIKGIVAVDKNWGIGKQGSLIVDETETISDNDYDIKFVLYERK